MSLLVDTLSVTPQSGEAGTTDVSFAVAAVNEGLDKEYLIRANAGDASSDVRVKHLGLREVFACSDGDFAVADGGTFNVLKGADFN